MRSAMKGKKQASPQVLILDWVAKRGHFDGWHLSWEVPVRNEKDLVKVKGGVEKSYK